MSMLLTRIACRWNSPRELTRIRAESDGPFDPYRREDGSGDYPVLHILLMHPPHPPPRHSILLFGLVAPPRHPRREQPVFLVLYRAEAGEPIRPRGRCRIAQ